MRFSFRGSISVEELWDLDVEQLDIIFKNLNSKLKSSNEESLLEIKTKENKELDIKIEIVKYIVKTKLDEKQKAINLQSQKEHKQKILAILERKQDQDLENKSVEELENMLNDM